MTRHEVLSFGRMPGPAETRWTHRGVRQESGDMRRVRGLLEALGAHDCGRPKANPGLEGPSPGLSGGKTAHLSGNTQLILKAACAQYLGYYPTRPPCNAEIRTILREMARNCGSWENGIGCMENCFRGTENAIRQIRKYARENGIPLPAA